MPTARQLGSGGQYIVELSDLNVSLRLSDTAKNHFSTHSKSDEFRINWTTMKALVYTGGLYSDALDRRDIIDRLPGLNPKRCRMSDAELQSLLGRLQASMMANGIPRDTFELLNEFLRYETPLHEIEWQEKYSQ